VAVFGIRTLVSQAVLTVHSKYLLMSKSESENQAYAAWIKIDDSLPWIELRETFQTKTEAHESAKEKLNAIKIKIVKMPQ
jgi:hypothetical protein